MAAKETKENTFDSVITISDKTIGDTIDKLKNLIEKLNTINELEIKIDNIEFNIDENTNVVIE